LPPIPPRVARTQGCQGRDSPHGCPRKSSFLALSPLVCVTKQVRQGTRPRTTNLCSASVSCCSHKTGTAGGRLPHAQARRLPPPKLCLQFPVALFGLSLTAPRVPKAEPARSVQARPSLQRRIGRKVGWHAQRASLHTRTRPQAFALS
jgi:hypothetical protein